MAQLFSDLVDSQGRRYFFDLKSAPGGIAPSTGQLVITGYAPSIQPLVQAFRTPAPAVLNVVGHTIVSPARVTPGVGALTITATPPNVLLQIVVTNALPDLDYDPPNALAPTVVFITTVTPDPAMLTLTAPPLNASPGGDIGYVSPSPGLISLVPRSHGLIFLEAGSGLLNVQGQIPTVIGAIVVEPQLGALALNPLDVTIQRPFEWIDVDAPPPLVWTTTAINR